MGPAPIGSRNAADAFAQPADVGDMVDERPGTFESLSFDLAGQFSNLGVDVGRDIQDVTDLKRPGFDGGSDPARRMSYASTEEV